MKRKVLAIFLSFSILLTGCNVPGISDNEEEIIVDFSGMAEERIIIHAMGGLEGRDYLNCLEGLSYHYIRGSKFYEIDLRFSSDGKIIGTHEFEYVPEGISYSDFKDYKILNRYTGMTYELMIETMQEHKDLYYIIDTKESNELAVYEFLIDEFKKVDEKLLDRIIPQIYDQQIYHDLEESYQFPEYIYTLYKTTDTAAQILSFLSANDRVTTITMQYLFLKHSIAGDLSGRDFYNKTFTDDVVDMGKKLYFHTINICEVCDPFNYTSLSVSALQDMFEEYRITGIYTDEVNVNMLKDRTNIE